MQWHVSKISYLYSHFRIIISLLLFTFAFCIFLFRFPFPCEHWRTNRFDQQFRYHTYKFVTIVMLFAWYIVTLIKSVKMQFLFVMVFCGWQEHTTARYIRWKHVSYAYITTAKIHAISQGLGISSVECSCIGLHLFNGDTCLSGHISRPSQVRSR